MWLNRFLKVECAACDFDDLPKAFMRDELAAFGADDLPFVKENFAGLRAVLKRQHACLLRILNRLNRIEDADYGQVAGKRDTRLSHERRAPGSSGFGLYFRMARATNGFQT